MGANINCIYCSRHLFCTHPTRKKFLWLFRRQCVYATGEMSIGQDCQIQKRFPEPDLRRVVERAKLNTSLKICVNCQSYNENWESEMGRNRREPNWCKKMSVEEMLNDKESEKLGYCKNFVAKKVRKRMKAKMGLIEWIALGILAASGIMLAYCYVLTEFIVKI